MTTTAGGDPLQTSKILKPVNNNINSLNNHYSNDTTNSGSNNNLKYSAQQPSGTAAAAAATPPSAILLTGTSRNMNYDHRKYANLGAVKYSNNHHPNRTESTSSIASNNTNDVGSSIATKSSNLIKTTTSTASNNTVINSAVSLIAANRTLIEEATTTSSHHQQLPPALTMIADDDLMDSFEARMLQEMKAEMDAQKLVSNPKGSSGENGGGVGGSNRSKTTMTNATTSGIGGSSTGTIRVARPKRKAKNPADSVDIKPDEEKTSKMASNTGRVNNEAVSGEGDELAPSPLAADELGRRGSSEMQSPWSEEHDQPTTTSEKYNFDAMTSSIEDTTTSLSKKAVNFMLFYFERFILVLCLLCLFVYFFRSIVKLKTTTMPTSTRTR